MCWVERKAQRGCHSCPKRCDSVLLGEGRAGVLHGRDFCSKQVLFCVVLGFVSEVGC